MNPKQTELAPLLGDLRWLTPAALALVGIGYVLFKEIIVGARDPFGFDIFFACFTLGLLSPAFAWLTLTWAARMAKAEARAQLELAQSNQELAALNAIGEVATESLDLDAILEKSLEKLTTITGLQAAEIRLVEDGRLVLKSHYGVSPEFVESTLSIPLKGKDRVVGVIHIASRDPNAFGEREQHLLMAVGQRIAMTVENARLFRDAQRRALHLETASLVGQRVTALMDVNLLLTEVVRLIREKFEYDHAHIFLVDEDSLQIVLKAASEASAESVRAQNLRLKIGQEGITGWVAHTGQTLVCNDVSREPRYSQSELAPDTKSELAVPLRVGRRVIGVLDVQSNDLGGFDKEDVTVLQILGNQLGVAIENARLFAETKSRYEAMIALHAISLDVISQLDHAELLEALLKRGVNLWGAQAGSLLLYDRARAEIRIGATYNLPWNLAGVTFHLGEGLVGRVIESGQPQIVNDYDHWEGHVEEYVGTHLTAMMCAPLKWRNEVFGGITILTDANKRVFDTHDVWLLTLFADLATIAIKNAELHTEIKDLNTNLEHKVDERTQQLSLAKEKIAAQAEQLRSLFANTIHIQEEERARIARDMHDGVMQLVASMRYELKAAKIAVGTVAPARALEKLDAMREVLGEMEQELRHAIYDLHPPALDAVDLVPALSKYTQTFSDVFGVLCEVNITGAPFPLPEPMQVAVFRIIEEALQNVAVHARANTALVNLEFCAGRLCVEVRDNGRGFDSPQWSLTHNGSHLGLVSMQERVRSLAGTMEITSMPGAGTCLKFCLPVRMQAEPATRPPVS